MVSCFGGSSSSSNKSSKPAFKRGKPIQRKLVVLGDGACGKTSLLNVFTRGFFTQVYEPTVFENYVQDIQVDDEYVEMSLWDTAGQEEFDRLRSLSYAETHVIMLCFSVDNPNSMANVESKIVLVALKCDLRDDRAVKEKLTRYNQAPVQYEEGLAVARRIRASRYLECSAKHNRGVTEVFLEAARVSINAKRVAGGNSSEGGRGCVIM
ncbi:small GTPase Rho3/GTP-binding protein Rho3 [Exidia glandulosa HHB12029]|uniref:Small GTPase Rho3/GTP-binding protein Rho3 n=1 Tax=Exidia glandulosa HHB12029 TaxID=1314781 RepID=A0A165FU23_EXIGL|nr:small GTPase Rho3/GTP-binding protein Rho3 [Exidia glandulosa HHB12029]